MHELSIIMSIIDIVENEAFNHPGKNVKRVDLDIGRLAGIEFEAFDFLWETSTKNTILNQSEMHINFIDGRAKCHTCQNDFRIDQLYDECPKCGSFEKDVLGGKEMRIKSITMK